MKFLSFIFFISFSFNLFAEDKNWGAVVFSDIHIKTRSQDENGHLPLKFKKLLNELPAYIKENNIKFIFLLGDSTSGNENDTFSLTRVKNWWDDLYKNFLPIEKLGVQIIPIAGNHDYYTKNHQLGFEYGSNLFFKNIDPNLKFNKNSPLYFSLDYQNTHFIFLHLVSYSIDKKQLTWLKSEMERIKSSEGHKIALGHVPLYTRLIKKPFVKFGDQLRHVLENGNVNHYICGHEHYFWDENFGEENFRQTIMGTSSGTYNFVPNITHYQRFCSKNTCEFPASNLRVEVNESDRKQIFSQMFLHLNFNENKNYEMIPMAFFKDEIISFNLP